MEKQKKKNSFLFQLLDDEVRKQLESFQVFLSKRESFHYKNSYYITIENMSRNKTKLLIEMIAELLENNKQKKEILEVENSRDLEDVHDTIFVLSIETLEDCGSFLWRSLKNSMIKNNNDGEMDNLFIIVSSDELNQYYYYLKDHFLSNLPKYSFYGDKKLENSYQRLLELFEINQIEHSLSFKEFQMIWESIQSNKYVAIYDIENYLFDYAIVSKSYRDHSCVTIDTFDELINDKEEEETDEVKEPTISLSKLPGLKNVKKEVNSLFCYANFMKKLTNCKDIPYLNMFFLGNPGTGKTMISEVIAQKLFKLGYLEDPEVIKIVPNDLIGEYVGHTKSTTRKILNKAQGKLLFIDEAYLICSTNYRNGKNPFMEEAMVELLKYLEDPKNIVIFSGYKDELRKLYNMNPGLKSRIYKEILFNDYSIPELYKILSLDLEKKGLYIDDQSKNDIIHYIKELREEENFGNARTMLQLSQKLIMNHANQKRNDFMIDVSDIPKDEIRSTKRMGFGVYDR